jgi:putative ABC transport system permease protein
VVARLAALLVRWSLRDLRARWLQVAAVALIAALGSGFYSGLASTAAWRRASYDASYRAVGMFDLRLTLAGDSYVRQGRLLAVVRSLAHAGWVAAADERLVGPAQVDASRPDRTILVPGRVVGLPVGARVARVAVAEGRGLRPGDAGRPVALLDAHFARHYGLPPRGSLVLGGGRLRYVGLGLGAEYFLILGEQGTFLAEAGMAVVFTSLRTAQRLLGRPGLVNSLVLRARPGTDVEELRAELAKAMRRRLPSLGFELDRRQEDRSYRLLYRDIDSDQRLYTAFALLVMLGACLAAFNLVARMVEAQRREIGIGMALGAPTPVLALRPLLVGLEVALLGVLFGIGVGLGVEWALARALRSFQPLPEWKTGLDPLVFLRGAALGLVLPVLAAAYPVWRALRVAPVQAIRTGALTAATGGPLSLVGRISLPGSSIAQLPLRNVLRTPRRTLLTVLGVAVAIALLVGVVGMVDSFLATIDRAEREVARESPERLLVGMRFAFLSSPQVQAVLRSPLVARASAGLELPGRVRHGRRQLEVVVEMLDFARGLWRPSVLRGSLRSSRPAIVLSEKAARDLGVDVGDTVLLRHPRRVGLASYRLVDSPLRVAAIDPLPSRFTAFMDRRWAGLMNLSGIVNRVSVLPAPGVTADEAERALFRMPGVTSVQPVSAFTETVRQGLAQRLEVLYVVEAAVLLLALLVAFNSASINVDERRREHATMLAFGLPAGAVLAVTVAEGLLVGVVGAALGLGLGRLLLGWMIDTIVSTVVPDIGVIARVAPRTVAMAFALGAAAVALAPLLLLRRLRRMDIPAALRVVE